MPCTSKSRNYDGLDYTFGKTYFTDEYSGNNAKNFVFFYSYNHNMDNAVSKHDGKDYYSGTAQYWIDNINTKYYSKHDLVFADLLCYNYSVFGKEYHYDRYWVPLTYTYAGHYNIAIRDFAVKLQSLEFLSKASQIFGYDNVEALKTKIMKIEELYKNGEFQEYRHSNAFEYAPILCRYIKSENLGTLK